MLTFGNFEQIPLTELAQKGLITMGDQHVPVVLVVDDEQIIADTRAAILTGWGYAVLTAYDAESALELARVIPPELLISDVILTRMNGVDLAISMREMVPDCKVILFSGLTDGYEFVAGARHAGHEFTLLSKPVHPAQLWALLAELNLRTSTSRAA
jgi:DNA-binding response OmpR family regulator